MSQKESAPILENKYFKEPSVFQSQNLLKEARRQKKIPNCNIPTVCVLDPTGDFEKGEFFGSLEALELLRNALSKLKLN